MQGWMGGWGGTGPYMGGEEGCGGGTLFSNPIENACEGQSKRSQEKGRRMECDNRKMPLMVVSLRRRDVERCLC